jgi:hypothetical protein
MPPLTGLRQGLARGDPDLISDDRHHEEKVEAEGPEDEEFGAFEVAAGDVVLLGADELVVFEGGEGEGLIGSAGVGGFFFRHEANSPISVEPTFAELQSRADSSGQKEGLRNDNLNAR